MFENYMDVITRHYVDFNGRARRSQFWYFVLMNIIVGMIVGVIQQMLSLGTMLSGLYTLAVFLPNLGLSVRRLHDVNRSGWWLLLAAIPIVGWIVLIYWDCVEGTPGPNEYGPDPKGVAQNIPQTAA